MTEKVSQRSTVLHGPLRFIVRSAHKWGGNGTKPKFAKIKRVLETKHPEVIAKVFQGDGDKAAAWIKDAWYRYYGISLKGKTGAGPTYWRGKNKSKVEKIASKIGRSAKLGMEERMDQELLLSTHTEVPREMFEDTELFLASDRAVKSDDGLVWLEATRTGTWKRDPRGRHMGPLELSETYLQEVVSNFNDGAWEHVTVPLSEDLDANTHKDLTIDNRGFVRKLHIAAPKNDPDKKVLLAGVEFKDPQVEEKVLSGAIAGRSVGIGAAVERTSDGKTFTNVLKHLALTNKPWIDKLAPGAVDPDEYMIAASLDADDQPKDAAFAVEQIIEAGGTIATVEEEDPDEPSDETIAALLDDDSFELSDEDVAEANRLIAADDEMAQELGLSHGDTHVPSTDVKTQFPDSANYRVSGGYGKARCGMCEYYVTAPDGSVRYGWCQKYDAQAEEMHVSDGFHPIEVMVNAQPMHAAKDEEEMKPIIRLLLDEGPSTQKVRVRLS